jgi:hypothetical protein
VQHTVDVIATLSKKYAQASFNGVVVGIQLLNERAFFAAPAG